MLVDQVTVPPQQQRSLVQVPEPFRCRRNIHAALDALRREVVSQRVMTDARDARQLARVLESAFAFTLRQDEFLAFAVLQSHALQCLDRVGHAIDKRHTARVPVLRDVRWQVDVIVSKVRPLQLPSFVDAQPTVRQKSHHQSRMTVLRLVQSDQQPLELVRRRDVLFRRHVAPPRNAPRVGDDLPNRIDHAVVTRARVARDRGGKLHALFIGYLVDRHVEIGPIESNDARDLAVIVQRPLLFPDGLELQPAVDAGVDGDRFLRENGPRLDFDLRHDECLSARLSSNERAREGETLSDCRESSCLSYLVRVLGSVYERQGSD